MMPMRRVVLSVSIGHRPWFQLFRPYMEVYARRWRADFRAIVSNPADPPMSALECKAKKIDAIYLATAEYDEILYLDDSVFIRPDSLVLDLPETLLHSALLATVESHLPDWRQLFDQAFVEYGVDPPPDYVLFNSGVMLISRKHRRMFHRASARAMRSIGTFADQLWLNVMRYKFRVPLADLGPAYNYVGSFLRDPENAPLSVSSAQFVHVTRAAGDASERLAISCQLIERFG